MELEELIKTLDRAQEMATEGEWRVMPAGTDAFGADTYDIESFGLGTTGRPLTTGVWSHDARAIAVWRNTAEEVLRQLGIIPDLQSDLRMASSDLKAMESCASQAIYRSESAETEVERLKASKKDPTP